MQERATLDIADQLKGEWVMRYNELKSSASAASHSETRPPATTGSQPVSSMTDAPRGEGESGTAVSEPPNPPSEGEARARAVLCEPLERSEEKLKNADEGAKSSDVTTGGEENKAVPSSSDVADAEKPKNADEGANSSDVATGTENEAVPSFSGDANVEKPTQVPFSLSGGQQTEGGGATLDGTTTTTTTSGDLTSDPLQESLQALTATGRESGFIITALSVFTRKDATTTTTSSNRAGVEPAGKTKSSDSPCCIVITGFTATNLFSHHHVPMLLMHHVRTKHRSSSKSKPGVLPDGVMSIPAPGGGDFYVDLTDPVPNPIHLSSSMVESDSVATVDAIGAVELEEYACNVGSKGWPQIRQIVPLADGQLLAVTCSSTGSDDSTRTALLLFQVGPDLKINKELFFHTSVISPNFHICPLKKSSEQVLLAGASSFGEVIVFDCSLGKLDRLCEFRCFPPDAMEEITSCTYCPPTTQLLVSLKSGKVLGLKTAEREAPRTERGTRSESSQVDHDLDSKDFGSILDMVGVSPTGVPFTCSSHVHWKEISLLQLNRRSPLHMNVAPEVAEGRRGPRSLRRQRANVDNSKILQYEPPLEQPVSGRLGH